MERNKGGRKPNPDGKDRKARQVYCTEDQVEYLRWWLKHKGDVPPKPWKAKTKPTS